MERLRETPLVPGFTVTTTFESDSDPDHPDATSQSRYPYGADFDPSHFLRAYREGDHYRPTYPPMYPDRDTRAREDDGQESISSDEDHDPDLDTEISHIEDQLAREQYAYTRATSYRDRVRGQAQQQLAARETDSWTRGSFHEDVGITNDDLDVVARAMTLRRDTPTRIELRRSERGASPGVTTRDHADDDDPATPTGAHGKASVKDKQPEPFAPHARFFIRRDKSAVTIKFDPPV
jgi:hypothetical protein